MDVSLFVTLAVLMFLLEKLVEIIKKIYDPLKLPKVVTDYIDVVVSFALAMLLVFGTGFNFIALILAGYGITVQYPVVFLVLSGLILTGGSSLIHELLTFLSSLGTKNPTLLK
jgi:hypothetical protein